MATKWDDDDDVVRPAGTVKPDIKVDLDAWHAKMKAAAKAPPSVSEREPPPKTIVTTTPKPSTKEPLAPAPLSDAEQKHLASEAVRAAEAVRERAGTKRKVRLRVKVSGWYPGSVPAVDFCDGHGHHFASAPRSPPETHDEYVRYWRAPFIAELKRLGFEVIEEDV